MVSNILVSRVVLHDTQENCASPDSHRWYEIIATVQKHTKRANVARIITSYEVGSNNTEKRAVVDSTRKESPKKMIQS